jgi:hypothetical protein
MYSQEALDGREIAGEFRHINICRPIVEVNQGMLLNNKEKGI